MTSIYTQTDGTPFAGDHGTTVEGYAADLVNGRVFARLAASQASRYGYQPPIRRETWARIMSEIGALARQSDALAQVASNVAGRINLYGTEAQAYEAVARAVCDAIHDGFDDVIRRTGPEPVRHSDAQRRYTIEECATLAYFVARCENPGKIERGMLVEGGKPSIGWCLEAIMRAHHVRAY